MSLRDRFWRAVGAEEESGEWHYPEYTKGCWGSHRHSLCWLCKLRYPFRMLSFILRSSD